MIALRNYIKNKFAFTEKNIIEDIDEWITIDSGYYNNIFDSPCLSFNIKDKIYAGDLPTYNNNVYEMAIKKLEKDFNVMEVHNHEEQQHIHIEGKLTKEIIDKLAEILQ